ncbi:MAG: PaaI family thioesterase [Deltaproteobacteria bacterium]|nr:PaaI family thioesterase [Deltaproteobacteria bacterium]
MEPLDPYLFGEEQVCFGCGPHNERGWRLKFFREGDDVFTDWTPEAGHDGPPGVLHGGLQATLMDEIAGWALGALAGCMGLTTHMSVRYYLPVRVGVPLRASARIVSDEGRTVVVRAKLVQEGKQRASAKINFVVPDEETAARIVGADLTDQMRRFLR